MKAIVLPLIVVFCSSASVGFAQPSVTPVITSATTATGTVGTAFTYQIAGTDTCAYANTHTDTNAYTYTHAYSRANAHTDTDTVRKTTTDDSSLCRDQQRAFRHNPDLHQH